MKRFLSLCLLLAMVCMFAVGCSQIQDVANSIASSIQKMEEDMKNMITDFTNQDFSSVTIDVTTVDKDGVELKSQYVISDDKMDYIVEQLSQATEGEDMGKIVELIGSAQIENGAFTGIVGDDVELPPYEELKNDFDFDLSNLKNMHLEEDKFAADVVSPEALLGFETDITDMQVQVDFPDGNISSVTMTYKTPDGATVTTVYTFQK